MKTDFHFHTALSKRIGFEMDFFQQTVQRAVALQMDALLLTDHFDTPGFEDIYRVLDDTYEYNGDFYLVEGVRGFPGIEVAVKEGPHLIAAGSREKILAFFKRLSNHLHADNYASTAQFFEFQDDLDLLTIFAHPFRQKREMHRVDPKLLERFDALDLNGKDLFTFGFEHQHKVITAGHELGKPVVSGSDTHHSLQLGCVYTRFRRMFSNIMELKEQIAAQAYEIVIEPTLPESVQAAQAAKQAIKAQRLGLG